MGKLTKIALAIAGIGMLNTGINQYLSNDIRDNSKSIGNIETLVENVNPKNPHLKESAKIQDESYKWTLFVPVWNTLGLIDKQESAIVNLVNEPALKGITVSLGVALDSKFDLKDELAQAKEKMSGYGFFMETEMIESQIPESFETRELFSGIKNSFSRPHEFYMILTDNNYTNEGKDYSIKSYPSGRTFLLDGSFDRNDIDKAIIGEILRYVADERYYEGEFQEYDKDISHLEMLKQISKITAPDYDTLTFKDIKRTIELNIGVDSVDAYYAVRLMEKASKEFSKEFGIEFKINGVYDHKLPDAWDSDEEIMSLRKKVADKSDIYLLMTGQDWGVKSDSSTVGSECGQASPYYGYCWIETGIEKMDIEILCHELAHLFNVEHDYNSHSIMTPYYHLKNKEWTNYSKSTILKNKFRKWELSE